MADIFKYVVYFDALYRQIPGAGNAKISPIEHVLDCFGGTGGVELIDLSTPAGTGTAVGFGMKTLKEPNTLPHSIAILKLPDLSAGQTPPAGLTNNAIDDAIVALAGMGGGYEITAANAVLLAGVMFPADSVVFEGTTYNTSAPYLLNNIIVRDVVAV